eukprot:scaffold146635_cov17-Tisochrysis_lutea.AAC.1
MAAGGAAVTAAAVLPVRKSVGAGSSVATTSVQPHAMQGPAGEPALCTWTVLTNCELCLAESRTLAITVATQSGTNTFPKGSDKPAKERRPGMLLCQLLHALFSVSMDQGGTLPGMLLCQLLDALFRVSIDLRGSAWVEGERCSATLLCQLLHALFSVSMDQGGTLPWNAALSASACLVQGQHGSRGNAALQRCFVSFCMRCSGLAWIKGVCCSGALLCQFLHALFWVSMDQRASQG